ncbi:GNAT family N-acetyltransferase [Kutzneria sp. CA-103260]|uniref:GNAT family N-acetyltransferase n=1 Tax=Kutzneria sp. CA-103260 TaxID=2802641 RepID=UPI001BA47A1F|nr:GNAT family N-acetyltransferase [Kutzneria sp. CA-103260]QUQ63271.1 N-acetyltransferase [Kutzneria sp. CA-103260]
METERLLLRPAEPSDVDDLRALDADPEVMRFLGTDGASSVELIGRTDYWVGIERASGDFVGWFGLADELGYRIRRDKWGRGYATEGAKALLDKAFAEGRERVTAQTMAVNTGSRRVLEKLGLRHVRTFHVDWENPLPGSEHGEVEYEISVWPAGTGTAPPRAR